MRPERARISTVMISLGAAGLLAGVSGRQGFASPAGGTAVKAQSQQQRSGGVVAARVVTPDGQPVKGARVSWIGRGERAPVFLAETRTDATGRFQFDRAAELRRKAPDPQLLVEAPGWSMAFERVPEGSGELAITLRPATELRVRFVDPEGKPAPGLRVRLEVVLGERNAFLWLHGLVDDRFTWQTDAEGRVTIPGLPRSGQARVDIEDGRFAHLEMENVRLAQDAVTAGPTIALLPGASVRGRITFGPTGKPAAGIRVGAQGAGVERGWGEGVTAADGSYVMTRVRPGVYNVALDLKGDLARSWTAAAHERLTLATGEQQTGVDFTLIHGAVISGRVTAADNGEPVKGIPVGVYGPAHPMSGAWVQGAETGADGRYSHRVPPGKQHLYLMLGAPPPGFLLPAQSAHDLEIRDGETVTFNFQLPRGAAARPARGRVVGPDGQPVAGAEILAASTGRFGGGLTTLRSDASGSFTLDERQLAQPVILRARHGRLATAKSILVTGGDRPTLSLQPDVLAALSGRVTDGAAQPIAGAEVRLVESQFDTGHSVATVLTDAEGRYSFAEVWPDGRYSVNAAGKGFGQQWASNLELKPGEARTLDPLVLKQADRVVAGRVVNSNGDPQSGVQVNLNGRESQQAYTTTDREGRFRFDQVVDERVRLQAHWNGRWMDKAVSAGTEDVILVLLDPREETKPDPIRAAQARVEALLGKPAPPLKPSGWVNTTADYLSHLRGKPVLIDFWSVGCGPCVASLPGVARAAEQLAPRGGVVVGLHDSGITAKELEKFAREHRLTYPLAIDTADEQQPSAGKTFRAYGVEGIPTVAVLDREGKLVFLGYSLEEGVARMGALVASGRR
jgi:5-hydroxyisourate hydrolase-like protein (transthyretin family)/thiol-disulfide isomerase/thioredoxin